MKAKIGDRVRHVGGLEGVVTSTRRRTYLVGDVAAVTWDDGGQSVLESWEFEVIATIKLRWQEVGF